MTNTILSRRVRAAILLAPVLAASAFAGAPAQAAVSKNDGRWSVEVITDKGDCDRAYRYSVLIQNGEPRYGGSEPITVTGKLASNGSLKGTIAYGDNRANVSGQLANGWGSGSWTFNGSRTCSGHWNAEKRG